MRILKSLSIRTILYSGIIATGILFVVIIITLVSITYRSSSEAYRMGMANKFADHIIIAAGWQELERGMTTTALASDKPAEGAVIEKIKDLRAKGDDLFKKARETAGMLSAHDHANTHLKESLKKMDEARIKLEDARSRADQNLSRETKDFKPQEWFETITNFIDTNADLRMNSITSPSAAETFRDGVRMNLELKQAVWLISEYAGRERAIIGGLIAAGRAADESVLNTLRTFRAIVDLNLKGIKGFGEDSSTDPELVSAIKKMEEMFFGRFEKTRQDIYATTYLGNYQITAQGWIERSTEAINTVLDVGLVASRVVERQLQEVKDRAKMQMYFFSIMLIILIIAGFVPFVIIQQKIISPMYFLMNSMLAIEETNDLTYKIDTNSKDEIGQTADAFNRMLEKFHKITKDSKDSAATLASASTELAASSEEIAKGSDEQSAKTSQVATASTEMSATILEIAKNASSAADAAEKATKSAATGGEIVGKSIESINSIANITRETSKVIATLENRSSEIGKIIKVIDDIADQTNLLALNAAIEAARAGEQGRGFAVVADEVRKLAERTGKATKEIGGMIKAIQDDTNRALSVMESEVKAVEGGVQLVQNAGSSLKDIISQVEHVTGMIQQIAAASEEQSTATDQITRDVETVAGITKTTALGAKEIAKTSSEISRLAVNLNEAISMFKLSEEKERAEFWDRTIKEIGQRKELGIGS